MKRFLILLGAVCIALGLKIGGGLWACGYDGELGVGSFDTAAANGIICGPHRIDLSGDMDTAESIIKNLGGKKLFSEEVGDIVVIYAYSQRLCSPVIVHGQKVNLMIAVSERGVTAGTPLIYGSY